MKKFLTVIISLFLILIFVLVLMYVISVVVSNAQMNIMAFLGGAIGFIIIGLFIYGIVGGLIEYLKE